MRVTVVLLSSVLLLASCTGEGDSGPSGGSTGLDGATAGSATPSESAAATETRTAEEQDRIDGYAIRLSLPEVDLSKRMVDLTEIESGGVGADSGIPSLHDPKFVSGDAGASWVGPREPVVVLEVGGEARIYPIQILMWHEVVNDVVAGEPVLVTFCPLCHTAIAFDRRVDGEVRDFGVSGLLRESDLIVYDYQTTTLWQQLTGEAIVGTDAGKQLRFLPAQIVAFEDARAQFPEARVLSQDTGFNRAYGVNPYPGYDSVDSLPVFDTSFSTVDAQHGRLPAKTQVLALEIQGEAAAFPFEVLSERFMMQATVGGVEVAAFWQPGTSAALDERVLPAGRDVGSAGAFVAEIDGVPVTFEARDGAIYDEATGSRWNILGAAVEGPLAGTRLDPVVSGSHFWFVWSVFKPDTRVIVE